MQRTIRIGNAGGYWGDDPTALRRQLAGGPLDYVSIDYLAEVTMSILQKQRQADPALGYATDFVTQLRDCLPLARERGTRIVTNAGGMNRVGLGRRLVALARELGLDLKVGVVHGDDIHGRLTALLAAGEPLAHLETGAPLAPHLGRVLSANVYFGAEPVVRALAEGCDVIVTGRVTDTGITLAPLIHEFGWDMADWDRMATGVVAGHVIECGCQASGGNLTDWQDVPSFHNMGYPIVEVEPSGAFTVTKHPGTGGLVSAKTVKEQLVYEMGDPGRYISPDGVARFDTIRLTETGRNRVRVSEVRGLPAPDTLKVSLTLADGWKGVGELLVSGPDVRRKARAIAAALWRRLAGQGHRYEATHASLVGDDAAWPASLRGPEPGEILLRLGVRDHDRAKVEAFGVQLPALILAGPPGLAVTGGRPKPAPVVAYWPALLRRERALAHVLTLDTAGTERNWDVPFPMRGEPAPASPRRVRRTRPAVRPAGGRPRALRLRDLAYARSGDKGDTCNVGVIARSPAIYAWLLAHLTAARVRAFFKGRVRGKVVRHELDNLLALNFLLERALGGGGTVSLVVDPQGKTFAQALLQMPMTAPASLLKATACPSP